MSDRIRRTFEIGDRVVFLKSNQECTVVGYNDRYNKLVNHNGRLLVCPDSGLKRAKPLEVVRPIAEQRSNTEPTKELPTLQERIEEKEDRVPEQKPRRKKKDPATEIPNETLPAATSIAVEAPKEENVKPKRRRKKSDVPVVQEGDGTGIEAAKQ